MPCPAPELGEITPLPHAMHSKSRRRRRRSLVAPASCRLFEFAHTLPKFRRQPPVANQLFSMLPSSNVMGAKDKFERGSRWARKGACQWNHSCQHSGWTPAEHGCLSNALQFLIANLELEFDLSPKRISNLEISNRKFMTIFQSENLAASEFRRLQPTNPTILARGSSHA